jgi:tRNA threonylcarbamoyladenosine biosynthesis protein TsaE
VTAAREHRVELADAAATEALGELLGRRLRPGQGLALCGELGAGKTCLARGVARGRGSTTPTR